MNSARLPLFLTMFFLGLTVAEALTNKEQADAFLARGAAAEARGEFVVAGNCYALAMRAAPNYGPAQSKLVDMEKKLLPEGPLKLVVPKINLRDATFTEAVGFLQRTVAAVAPGVGERIQLRDPGGHLASARITLSQNNISVGDLLRLVCQTANATYKLEGKSILISPAPLMREDAVPIDVASAIANRLVTVSSSSIDTGQIGLIFDKKENTLVRTAAVNPMVVTLQFTTPQRLAGMRIFFNGGSSRWRIDVADSKEDLDAAAGTYATALDWTGGSSDSWHSRVVDMAQRCRVIRLILNRLTSDNYVHLNEWQLFLPPEASAEVQPALGTTAPSALPIDPSILQKAPGKPSASRVGSKDRVEALNDGKEPSSSSDKSIPRHTWFPARSNRGWVQYDFPEPITLEGCGVIWFIDTGAIRLPKYWKVLVMDEAGTWLPVPETAPEPVADSWNILRFRPARAKGLRISAQMQENFSGGVLEWKIIPSTASQPSPINPPPALWLDDLVPTTAQAQWGGYLVNVYNEDKNSRVLVDGVPCERFLFTHADSTATFAVPPGYTRFSALGIGPSKDGRTEYSWTYKVVGDDKPLFESQRLDSYPNHQVAIDIELPPGTRTLTLITDSLGNGFADHSLWANPRFLRPPVSAKTQAQLAQLKTQFNNGVKTKVDPAYQQAMKALRVHYLAALQRSAAAAQKSGDQAGFAALQEELGRMKTIEPFPETDAPGTPASLASLRAAYRTAATAAATARATQSKPLYDQYDTSLVALAQSVASQPGDVVAVNEVRAKLATERQPPSASPPARATPSSTPSPVVPPPTVAPAFPPAPGATVSASSFPMGTWTWIPSAPEHRVFLGSESSGTIVRGDGSEVKLRWKSISPTQIQAEMIGETETFTLTVGSDPEKATIATKSGKVFEVRRVP